jgi:hypothetical protein
VFDPVRISLPVVSPSLVNPNPFPPSEMTPEMVPTLVLYSPMLELPFSRTLPDRVVLSSRSAPYESYVDRPLRTKLFATVPPGFR